MNIGHTPSDSASGGPSPADAQQYSDAAKTLHSLQNLLESQQQGNTGKAGGAEPLDTNLLLSAVEGTLGAIKSSMGLSNGAEEGAIMSVPSAKSAPGSSGATAHHNRPAPGNDPFNPLPAGSVIQPVPSQRYASPSEPAARVEPAAGSGSDGAANGVNVSRPPTDPALLSAIASFGNDNIMSGPDFETADWLMRYANDSSNAAATLGLLGPIGDAGANANGASEGASAAAQASVPAQGAGASGSKDGATLSSSSGSFTHADYFRIANSEMASCIQGNMTLSQITTAIGRFGDDLPPEQAAAFHAWKHYQPWKKCETDENGAQIGPGGSVASGSAFVNLDGSVNTVLGPDGKPKKRYRPGKRQRDQEKRK